MKVCIFDHHLAERFTVCNGSSGISDILFCGLIERGFDVTYLLGSTNQIPSKYVNKVINLSPGELDAIRYGHRPICDYFNGDLFHSHTSGKHASFNFNGFDGRWLATCHGSDLEDAAADSVIFVGKDQMKRHFDLFDTHLRSKRVFQIYNCFQDGIEYRSGPHDQLVHLSVIRPDKGVHLLPYIAKSVGRVIHIYGHIGSLDYYNQFLKPHEGKFIEYLGPINSVEEKNTMFSQAELFIHPAIFHEPFGITLVESLKSGVPITGFRRGCLLEHQKNLAEYIQIFDSVTDLCANIGNRSYKCDPGKLIDYANRFCPSNMIDEYVRVYQHISA